jgi:hypothetical protein
LDVERDLLLWKQDLDVTYSHGSRPLKGTSSLGSRTWKANLPREQDLDVTYSHGSKTWK